MGRAENGAVARRAFGYRRFEGLEAAAALARLYRSLRLFVNYSEPSFKLAGKAREGARVRKRYHAPATRISDCWSCPCSRLPPGSSQPSGRPSCWLRQRC